MTTLKIYPRINQNTVIERTIAVSIEKIKQTFLRYAKTYRLAYGKMPCEYSLRIELNQYTGVTLDMLRSWMKEVEK